MYFFKRFAGPVLFGGIVLILCSVIAGGADSWAQDHPMETTPLPGLSKKISIDFRNIDVLEALRFLADQGEMNVVPTKNVGGRLTLTLKDVTIRDVLDVMMLTNEMAYAQKGQIIHVMTPAEYQRLYGGVFVDERRLKQIQVRYANVADVAAVLGNMKSDIGKVIADPQTGTVILMDVSEKLGPMVETAKGMDQVAQPQSTEVFELKYAEVDKVKEEVAKVLTPTLGTMRADKRTNTLAVTDLPRRMREVRTVIAAFDRPHRQVMIEAKVMQIRLGDKLDLGIDWETVLKGIKGMDIVGSFPITPAPSQAATMTVGTLAKDRFTAVFKFIQTLGKTDLLSTPQISVLENEEAKILVGTREAFITSVVTQTAQASTTAEALTFIDVGIKLKVAPRINDEGFVTMRIEPEVSSVIRTLTTALGNQVPIVETSTANTTVMVKDGNTLVIAGLIRDTTVKEEKRVPILGSIPILGTFFRSRNEEVVRGEIVFFLTPSIVTGEQSVASVATAPPVPPKEEKPVLDILKGLASVLGRMRGVIEKSTEGDTEGEE